MPVLPAAPIEPIHVLDRPRLRRVLTESPAPVTLVCAPAGAGKSTLIGSVVSGDHDDHDDHPHRPTALARIDQRSVSAPGLWDAVLGALRELGLHPTGGVLEQLRAPRGQVGEGFLDRVTAAIDELGEPVRLVLDDLHLIEDPDVLATLDRLLLRPPEPLQVVLVSRHDPDLSLARLRLDGRLRELRAPDLALDADETRALLVDAGVELTDAQLAVLLERTEGWAAGVRVAAIALADHPDPDRFLAGFGGTHRELADLVVTEVLARQPPELERFLRDTCVATTLELDLARELSGRDDAGLLLETLVHRQALTERLGPGRSTYRYHPVLRDVLQARLARGDPEVARELHRRAGRWYLAAGDVTTALEQLLLADELDELVDALRTSAVRLLLDGEEPVLARLLDHLDARSDRTEVALLRTLLLLDRDGPHAADTVLAPPQLEALAAGTDPWCAHVAAGVLTRRTTRSARRGPSDLPTATRTATDDTDLLLWGRMQAGYAALVHGEHAAGTAALSEVTRLARATGRDAVVVDSACNLGVAELMEGRLDTAVTHARAAMDILQRRGWSREPRALPAHVVLAWTGYLQLDQTTAATATDTASTIAGPGSDPRLLHSLRTCSVLVRIDGGADPRRTLQEHLGAVTGHLDTPVMSPTFHAHVGPAVVLAALDAGLTPWAVTFAEHHSDLDADPAGAALLQALLLRADGEHAEARRALAPALRGDQPRTAIATTVRALLLALDLELVRDNRSRVAGLLRQALELAAPTRLWRPFLELADGAHPELAGLVDHDGVLGSAAHELHLLLRTRVDDVLSPPPAQLTPAEADAVRDLPSLLTVRELAEQRGVSVNTIKSHRQAVYRKLGVRTRRDAIAEARLRGLL